MNELNKKLSDIQKKLNVPKNQVNKFGGYNYRSCEDILEAVKPLLGELTLIVSDEIVQVGDRYYVKATATLSDGENVLVNSAFARESEAKTGMDSAQITGSASSYARKYALNGLFAIDDTKDADTMDNTKEVKEVKSECAHQIIEKVAWPQSSKPGNKFKSCTKCNQFLGWIEVDKH